MNSSCASFVFPCMNSSCDSFVIPCINTSCVSSISASLQIKGYYTKNPMLKTKYVKDSRIEQKKIQES
ncbi:hypothetical protein AQUCO_06100067v1 [Aquilegia coerulea]|uniref:Uncharacterized protein n=1 Tax=Aquilegia coerulea TaxID=218851 RepID=A0A2G5CDE1_AQUCA|nr:hypothetical protein AQUCO_06100067v1 [Aquilegia coerulea]